MQISCTRPIAATLWIALLLLPGCQRDTTVPVALVLPDNFRAKEVRIEPSQGAPIAFAVREGQEVIGRAPNAIWFGPFDIKIVTSTGDVLHDAVHGGLRSDVKPLPQLDRVILKVEGKRVQVSFESTTTITIP
jgi:hypothetical protein